MVDQYGVRDEAKEQGQRDRDVGCEQWLDHAYKKVFVIAKEIYKMYRLVVTVIAEIRR